MVERWSVPHDLTMSYILYPAMQKRSCMKSIWASSAMTYQCEEGLVVYSLLQL